MRSKEAMQDNPFSDDILSVGLKRLTVRRLIEFLNRTTDDLDEMSTFSENEALDKLYYLLVRAESSSSGVVEE